MLLGNRFKNPTLCKVRKGWGARLITVDARYWVYKFTMDEPPMTAWGQAQLKAAKTSFGSDWLPAHHADAHAE